MKTSKLGCVLPLFCQWEGLGRGKKHCQAPHLLPSMSSLLRVTACWGLQPSWISIRMFLFCVFSGCFPGMGKHVKLAHGPWQPPLSCLSATSKHVLNNSLPRVLVQACGPHSDPAQGMEKTTTSFYPSWWCQNTAFCPPPSSPPPPLPALSPLVTGLILQL